MYITSNIMHGQLGDRGYCRPANLGGSVVHPVLNVL